jgi:hypothetical protein
MTINWNRLRLLVETASGQANWDTVSGAVVAFALSVIIISFISFQAFGDIPKFAWFIFPGIVCLTGANRHSRPYTMWFLRCLRRAFMAFCAIVGAGGMGLLLAARPSEFPATVNYNDVHIIWMTIGLVGTVGAIITLIFSPPQVPHRGLLGAVGGSASLHSSSVRFNADRNSTSA